MQSWDLGYQGILDNKIATDLTRPIQPVHAHYLKLFIVSAIAHPILLPLGRITQTGNSSFSRHMQYQLSTHSSSMEQVTRVSGYLATELLKT